MIINDNDLSIENIGQLLELFGLSRDVDLCKPFGSGHLNKTYEISCGGKKLVLQRINDAVFSPVPVLMANIQAVLSFVEKRRIQLLSMEQAPETRKVLTKLRMPEIIPTKSGDLATYWNNGWWRAYTRVDQAVAFDVPPDIRYLESAAFLAGVFCHVLRDSNAPELFEILPDFQMVQSRLERLRIVMNKSSADSCCKVQSVYDRIMLLQPVVDRVWRIDAPRFVVHNDLKFNNILFDEISREACSVVDLDTCSWGYLFYDFGDFIRASCATNEEDMITGMGVDVTRMKLAATAFLNGVGYSSILDIEKEQCIYAPAAITTALASRFLTDFLEGDNYFKPLYSGHNLVRAQAQITLAESFNDNTDVLRCLFDGIFRGC